MNYSALQKDQMMDIYIPSLKAYYQVKLVKVEDNAIVIGAVKRHQSKDDPVSEKLPLDVGKIYLIYFGIDENVYCGKTKLIAIVQGPKKQFELCSRKTGRPYLPGKKERLKSTVYGEGLLSSG